ncbi:hypothetical protein HUG17_7505 [Dermatophagoides farinae]|uniref:Uncharacterized protein n=1 Tax=Dermatophagoides farinae TaxID=6954 RepID=A0A9D4SCR1_DERFA|nr:hypothetical protein HUG17_7505 [Dermatophagoides farinae]
MDGYWMLLNIVVQKIIELVNHFHLQNSLLAYSIKHNAIINDFGHNIMVDIDNSLWTTYSSSSLSSSRINTWKNHYRHPSHHHQQQQHQQQQQKQ